MIQPNVVFEYIVEVKWSDVSNISSKILWDAGCALAISHVAIGLLKSHVAKEKSLKLVQISHTF